MRVLLVNDYASATGGAEILIQNLRSLLRARGHDARLLASRARPEGAPWNADYACAGTLTAMRTPLQALNPSARRAMRHAIREFRPDVVHVALFLTQLSPSILEPLRDVPALHHVQWFRAICPLGTKRLPDGRPCEVPWGIACLRNRCLGVHDWLPLMLQRSLLERGRDVFDAFVAPSNRLKVLVERAGISPVEVVPNAVPRPAWVAAENEIEPHAIGFAGRFVAEKGVRVLLDAFQIVVRRQPRARLVLVGDGPERPTIERRIKASKLAERVEITGWLPREEVDRRLATVAVQVVPSLWEEPFGLVAAEAMMRGTPVVASDIGGLGEVVEQDRTGMLVPPGDPEALAEALLALLENRELRRRLARAGEVKARERYALGPFVERMIGIYRRLAGA
ncbi:MAG TPA: glycosyltransferase [Gemmatimonadota bacterium]|nr:glycosyltransferase [Gemmatimonadota bacterium]